MAASVKEPDNSSLPSAGRAFSFLIRFLISQLSLSEFKNAQLKTVLFFRPGAHRTKISFGPGVQPRQGLLLNGKRQCSKPGAGSMPRKKLFRTGSNFP